jgi:hypothetical protein
MQPLVDRLTTYAFDPLNAQHNFNLALEYDKLGQTAGAVSFYLRAAEFSADPLLAYEALLKCAKCFNSQGSRNYTTRGLLQHAASLLPLRPEAHFLLSQFHEQQQEWKESYLVACFGIAATDMDTKNSPLQTNVGYPGKHGLLFQKAVASWWVGMTNQSREILFDLKANYKMDPVHATAVDNNLKNIGYPTELTIYTDGKARQLRYKFPGYDKIEKNFSQSFQDMFVLSMTNGKHNGFYLEVGSSFPFHTNNTALLETQFGWKGVSMDIDKECVQQFFNERKNTVMCVDATQVDFEQLLDSMPIGRDIDYLQLDADPPDVTLAILKRIPFHKYRFAVITFEHDFYRDPTVRPASRQLLTDLGYKLVVSDVAFNKQKNSFEDWWVHPALVDPAIVERMTDLSEEPKFVNDYIFSG